MDNPLEILMRLLAQEAGPRGYTMAGRVVPQGQTPSLRELMSRPPQETPDAEGFGALLAGSPLLLAAPKPYMKLGKPPVRGYHAERFPHEVDVRVKMPSGEYIEDTVKGLNRGHAIARARSNWEELPQEYIADRKLRTRD